MAEPYPGSKANAGKPERSTAASRTGTAAASTASGDGSNGGKRWQPLQAAAGLGESNSSPCRPETTQWLAEVPGALDAGVGGTRRRNRRRWMKGRLFCLPIRSIQPSMEAAGGAYGAQEPSTSPAEGGREGVRPQKTRKRRSWTVEEDAVLAAHVRAHGVGKWDEVPQSTGLARTGQSCRFWWLNSLRPGLKDDGIAFSRDEEIHLCRLPFLPGGGENALS
ncbi:hypothetical protein ZIOFF_028262 [Zingiber officinale]|uniref:Uncharacterized protein n=1 Tax=Zingiber officinale TaxID=94328 RepID=A0A8J5LES9_ZINOF|nr:hypothetical protein ZIOFF_028262 [Zingiber officinale]